MNKDKNEADMGGQSEKRLLPQDRYRLDKWHRELHRGEKVTLDSLDFPAIRHIRAALNSDTEECESCGRSGAVQTKSGWLCAFATGCHPNAASDTEDEQGEWPDVPLATDYAKQTDKGLRNRLIEAEQRRFRRERDDALAALEELRIRRDVERKVIQEALAHWEGGYKICSPIELVRKRLSDTATEYEIQALEQLRNATEQHKQLTTRFLEALREIEDSLFSAETNRYAEPEVEMRNLIQEVGLICRKALADIGVIKAND